MSLSRMAGKGALWQISGGGAQALIRLGSSMILARKLDPVDFGIFGMAHIVYGVFELLSANGMTSGIITKQEPDEKDLSTCFWTIMIMRLVIFLLMILLAPYIAIYMNDEKLTLTIRVVSLLILITGIGSVSQSLMSKALQFKQLAIIKSIGIVVESGLAVILVLSTNLRYWALVLSMLIGITLINILIVAYAKWFPKLIMSKNSFKYLFRFGINNMGSSITAYLSHNFDYFIVTKLLGTKMLGYYEFAYRIPHLINEKVTGPVGMVVFPALAKVKEDDKKIADGFSLASKYVAWVTFPALGGLAVSAPLIVKFLWGEKWLLIVAPLQILCVSAAINSIMDFSRTLFLCKNRPDMPFKFEVATLILAVFSVALFGYLYGLNGVAIGMVIARASSIFACYYGLKMINSSLCLLAKTILPPIVSTAMMILIVYILSITLEMASIGNNIKLVIAIITGVASYIYVVKLLYVKDYADMTERIKNAFCPP